MKPRPPNPELENKDSREYYKTLKTEVLKPQSKRNYQLLDDYTYYWIRNFTNKGTPDLSLSIFKDIFLGFELSDPEVEEIKENWIESDENKQSKVGIEDILKDEKRINKWQLESWFSEADGLGRQVLSRLGTSMVWKIEESDGSNHEVHQRLVTDFFIRWDDYLSEEYTFGLKSYICGSQTIISSVIASLLAVEEKGTNLGFSYEDLGRIISEECVPRISKSLKYAEANLEDQEKKNFYNGADGCMAGIAVSYKRHWTFDIVKKSIRKNISGKIINKYLDTCRAFVVG